MESKGTYEITLEGLNSSFEVVISINTEVSGIIDEDAT